MNHGIAETIASCKSVICEGAAHARKSKRLVKAFGQAAAALQLAQINEHNMTNWGDGATVKAATIEYKRTRENLLKHMGV